MAHLAEPHLVGRPEHLAETVFDAGLRKATVQQYQAAYDQTVANYRQTVLTAFQQVEDNLAALRVLSQVIEQQDAAIQSAERNLREATVRYTAGLDPYLNVIAAQTMLLSNQQAAVSFRTQQMVASVQLIEALGGGWDVSKLPQPADLGAKRLAAARATVNYMDKIAKDAGQLKHPKRRPAARAADAKAADAVGGAVAAPGTHEEAPRQFKAVAPIRVNCLKRTNRACRAGKRRP